MVLVAVVSDWVFAKSKRHESAAMALSRSDLTLF